MIQEEVANYNEDPMPFEEYIATWKQNLESLQIIPGPPGYMCYGILNIPEATRIVTEEEVLAQGMDVGEVFPNELETHYIRQIYREYGWPHAFRREEGFAAVKVFIEKLSASETCDREWEDRLS